MAFDAPYDHLLRLLANRGLAWLRDRIKALPDPLSAYDPALYPLAMAARLVPVLSGLRGMDSPLREIVAHRLDPALAGRAARLVWQRGADPNRLAPLLAGLRVAGHDQPLWQLAMRHVVHHPPDDLAEQLALSPSPDEALIARAEELLARPFIVKQPDEAHIDLFYRVLTTLYAFGATRPRLQPKVFGQAFQNCRNFAEWAVRTGHLTSIAQMITCIRLIDPDHDMSELLSEVIACQRPDGSFPAKCGWSDRPQDFGQAIAPTLAVVVALHLLIYRRWRLPAPAPLAAHPISACRDRVGARILPQLPQLRAMGLSRRLLAAGTITRALGCNGFALLGLQGHRPDRGQLCRLSLHLAGFPQAIQQARRNLELQPGLGDLQDTNMAGPLADALAQMQPDARVAPPAPEDWNALPGADDPSRFLRRCRATLLQDGAGRDAALLHDHAPMALYLAQREYRAFLARPRAPLPELLGRLDRLSLLARLFEDETTLAAAA